MGLGSLALDGTKLRANASRHKAMSYERMVKKERAAGGRDRRVAQERRRRCCPRPKRWTPRRMSASVPIAAAMSCPRSCSGARRGWRRSKKRRQALEAEAREAEIARRAELEAQGKKPGTPRDGRDPFAPKPASQRNFTDPESKIMKTSDGSFHQCYSGQAVVDCLAQVIVVAELSDQAPDARQLEPALEQLDGEPAGDRCAAAQRRGADRGRRLLLRRERRRRCEQHGLDPYIATGRFKHSEPQPPAPSGPIPNDATPKQRMARKTRTKQGRKIYSRRKAIVEPVFGQIDTVQDGRRVLIRGKPAARAQWRFECTIHNLLKLHRAGGLALLNTG